MGEIDNSLGGGVAEGFTGVTGESGLVGGQQGVGGGAEGVISREGFGAEDIEGGTGDPALVEGFDKGDFINDRAARGVNDVSAGFHAAELVAGLAVVF